MRKRTATIGLAVIALAVYGTAVPSAADTSRVRAVNTSSGPKWDPKLREIGVGDRIVWKNPTSSTHTVTAWKGPWSKDTAVAPGERTGKTFNRTGVYRYRCTVPGHSTISDGKCIGMCGKIVVR